MPKIYIVPRIASAALRSIVNTVFIQRLLIVLWALLACSHSGQLVLAQEGPAAITADEVNIVARQLWCPLCGGGLRLDTCELKACAQMKEMIAMKLAAGEDAESIKAYFLEQYGPQVLGEPPRQGFNWLAWILPLVAVVGSGFFLGARLRQMSRPVRQTASTKPDHEYERRLDEELAHYD